MALFKSQVLTQASGSVGGLTYSHSKGGMYMRSRAIPVNPNTARQQEVRDGVAMFSQQWLQVLTQIQRDRWDLYGANVAMKNRLGDTIYLSGQNHFIRANTARRAADVRLGLSPALGALNDAPDVFDLANANSVFTATYLPMTGNVEISFDTSAGWGSESDSAILVYMGRPRSVTRKFFSGPYRLAGVVRGTDGPPVASPVTFDAQEHGFPFAIGQRIRTAFVLSNGNAVAGPIGQGSRTFAETIVTA